MKFYKFVTIFTAALLSVGMLSGCGAINDSVNDESSVSESITDESSESEKDKDSSSEIELIKTNNFSKNYLCGIYYGGCGWGEFYDCLDGLVKIRYDKVAEVYMPILKNDIVSEYVLVDELEIADENFEAMLSEINLDNLCTLDPGHDDELCDGDFYTIIVYDTKDEVYKSVGGYEPTNPEFDRMYMAIVNNFPKDEINRIHDEWVDDLRSKDARYYE